MPKPHTLAKVQREAFYHHQGFLTDHNMALFFIINR